MKFSLRGDDRFGTQSVCLCDDLLKLREGEGARLLAREKGRIAQDESFSIAYDQSITITISISISIYIPSGEKKI